MIYGDIMKMNTETREDFMSRMIGRNTTTVSQ
jgi:hypothetical protein